MDKQRRTRMRRSRAFAKALSSLNSSAVSIVCFALNLYAFIALAAAIMQFADGIGYLSMPLLLAAGAIGWLPAVFIHELGHAATAQALGWRVWIFSVGPMLFRFRPRFSFELMSRHTIDAGGFVLPTPKTERAFTRTRDVLVTAGGPAASVISALAAMALAPLLDTGNPLEHFLAGILIAYSATSWSAAVLTLWPRRIRGRGNDVLQIHSKLKSRRPKQPAFGIAAGLKQYDFCDASTYDTWIRDPILAMQQRQTLLTSDFLAQLEAGDPDAAFAFLGSDSDNERTTLRAYVHALRGETDKAESALAKSIAMQADWKAGWRLRELALSGILTSAGEYADAERRLANLERDIAQIQSDPVWEKLIREFRGRLPATPVLAP